MKKLWKYPEDLDKYKLTPDRLACADGGIQISFGGVKVLLGEDNYDERLAQIEPILEKLNEKYPDTAGTLHLENYDAASENIPFVPGE